jgi:hypothetical protein
MVAENGQSMSGSQVALAAVPSNHRFEKRTMAGDSANNCGLVVDGSERFAAGVRISIKEDVEAEFSERMEKASWLGRLQLLTEVLHSFMSIPIEPSRVPCFENFG